jgi:hypothetical protein
MNIAGSVPNAVFSSGISCSFSMGYGGPGEKDRERQAALVELNRKWWFSTTRRRMGLFFAFFFWVVTDSDL